MCGVWACRHQRKIRGPFLKAKRPCPQEGLATPLRSKDKAMKMFYGVNIMPSTQQVYRKSGKGAGCRDPLRYAADYAPCMIAHNRLQRDYKQQQGAPTQMPVLVPQQARGISMYVLSAPSNWSQNGREKILIPWGHERRAKAVSVLVGLMVLGTPTIVPTRCSFLVPQQCSPNFFLR